MQEKKTTVQRLLVAAVAIIGFGISIASFIWRLNNQVSYRSFVLVAVYYGFLFYYSIAGYKKPHGNLIRYLLLILAFYLAASMLIINERWGVSWVIIAANNFAAIFIAYMAGRLNKFKKNIFVAALITVLLLIKSFWPIETGSLNFYSLFVLDRTMPIFMWASVALIYFLRFSEHKNAGIIADEEEETEE